MREVKTGAHSGQDQSVPDPHGFTMEDRFLAYWIERDRREFELRERELAIQERQAAAAEQMARSMETGADVDHQALVDRAIDLLHRVGPSRRKVAEKMGISESTLRGPKWHQFEKVLKTLKSMEHGLDVARMHNLDETGEG